MKVTVHAQTTLLMVNEFCFIGKVPFCFSFSARSLFFERQQMVQATPAPTPGNMSFALITVPEGASVTRCPAATGNDKDDVSVPRNLFCKKGSTELLNRVVLTLVLLNPDVPCLCKQCRSFGF